MCIFSLFPVFPLVFSSLLLCLSHFRKLTCRTGIAVAGVRVGVGTSAQSAGSRTHCDSGAAGRRHDNFTISQFARRVLTSSCSRIPRKGTEKKGVRPRFPLNRYRRGRSEKEGVVERIQRNLSSNASRQGQLVTSEAQVQQHAPREATLRIFHVLSPFQREEISAITE